MTFYKHIFPPLSDEQQDNYVQLGRYLVTASQGPQWDPPYFDMSFWAFDLDEGLNLSPDQVGDFTGTLIAGALGLAPRAGLAAQPGEDWHGYQERVLGVADLSPLEEWLFSSDWKTTDNTPVGAAMRLMYVLDYGVPGDFREIVAGRAASDYLDNNFLWDRIGMLRPS